ncbi:hypothetical protein L6164_036105 [Bauhinia variegata]|uniref:Uncharacterized protein n=1 Tax=Bauhinia variegata TaxID=167791 RepID=A0ACB9KG65_BAUVA|nr:hypothetical protein L6164_036105 [Bauhinia variegata]
MNSQRMEETETKPSFNSSNTVKGIEEDGRSASPRWCNLELSLGTEAETFQLEKAVCSHGLFMMAPNYWDPLSKTLTRPLRLSLVEDDYSSTSSSGSVIVSISQPAEPPSSLSVHVHGTQKLSPQEEHALLAQVSRMLRLSEREMKAVREFRKMSNHYRDGKDSSFNGRVFRSPTLFEDMVKCILLCNCQWSRTLSMAQALCELQLELQNESYPSSFAKAALTVSGSPKVETEKFIPNTPAGKEPKRKLRVSGVSRKVNFIERDSELEADAKLDSTLLPTDINTDASQHCKSREATETLNKDGSLLQFSNGKASCAHGHIGNFPSPKELANLDESFLAKRCKLGYRANRILELAQAIAEGRLQLKKLEELCKDANLSSYDQLSDQLKEIKGFGPFTRANVLMCMGYYHVIPTDSETIRHLKQVHSRKSTSQTVQKDVEKFYGRYEPYQFLAYWSEIWDFYERSFGKMNKMPASEYKLITASNMRSVRGTSKRKKIS